jgi:hypothetical protein
VDNERQLRTEFRRALDEVLPPVPWLEAAVTQDLHKRRSRRSIDRVNALPRSRMQLVAGVLVIVLAAVAAAAFLASQHAPQTAPAGAISIEAYQTMVKRDDGMVIVSRNDNCMTLESACDVSGKPAIALMQRWLDDLNASTPPARFAVIDAQMRRHLTVGISALNAIPAAYQAKDQSGLDRAHNLASDQQGWLDEATRGIAASQPGTAATYIASAQAASQAFGGCPSWVVGQPGRMRGHAIHEL